MIGMIVGGLTKAVGGYFENKSQESQAKANLKRAEIEAKTSVAKAVAEGKVDLQKLNAEWENKAVSQMDSSIKDEISLVVLLLPALLVFFEPFQDDVKRGFEILGTLPEYYQHLLYIAIAGSFGIKGVNHFIKRK
tara:strand:+ start:142 stop:546 length:405 start_codon:yes stop_codon:yes gene_type:complete